MNVIGAFLVARAALRGPQPPSSIVFNASVNALRPELNFLDYNASKAAVVSMAKSLALETSARGYRGDGPLPGVLPDPHDRCPTSTTRARRDQLLARIPAGRFGDLAEVAALVDFLLSPQAAFMTGQRRQYRRGVEHLTR